MTQKTKDNLECITFALGMIALALYMAILF